MNVEVVKPGLLTTLQDAGRAGFAHLGIGRAGAFDAPALRIANALCGNPRDACALELTLIGPSLCFRSDAWIAVTGAPMSFRVGGAAMPVWAPVRVPAGATLELGAIRSGCRGYLAVRGGFDVASVLGSRSTDVNARLGPLGGRPLQAGDSLPVADDGSSPPATRSRRGHWTLDPRPWFSADPGEPLRLLPARHLDLLTERARNSLFSETFTVHNNSDRVGVRLGGPTLGWAAPVEMVSEGCVPGLLQLPPSGQPIAFGPECPVSGGYPRIGQIAAVDVPRLAQRRPRDAVRFVPCSLDEALAALRTRENALSKLELLIRRRTTTDCGFGRDEAAAAPE
ncbi:MAG: biotin-dependent carboxyltransferase family protein [Rhodanobacteraceae bacterium]